MIISAMLQHPQNFLSVVFPRQALQQYCQQYIHNCFNTVMLQQGVTFKRACVSADLQQTCGCQLVFSEIHLCVREEQNYSLL